jgi:BMFP domain-containing protein YqiC
MGVKEDVQNLLDRLKQQRDELNVQMHLAAAEVRDEWAELEKKWSHFESRARHLGSATADAAQDVGSATKALGEELVAAYNRIRKSL